MAKVKLQFESLQACNKVDNDDDDDGNDSDHLHLSPPFNSTRETMNGSRESRKICCVDSDHDHAHAIIINLNGSEL